jgi:hypothetical protein
VDCVPAPLCCSAWGSIVFLLYLFHAGTMPRAWVNNLSKLQLEQLASQLGLTTDGALDDLRRRLREKWTTIEACLPSPILDKSSPIAESGQPRNDGSKVRLKLVT